ncbi:MAG: type II secretion system protein [Microcoleus sp. PH2017_29_MFU_D_A]|uniref:pilus assembly FimT family protein n=1 Tax=unclassified Microcoleus TaxID=2642155 RepID=UPI001D59349F|nr:MULTISPECIES: type II secretion system protein [unclassified Microcoleus]MCC3588545.1 type II secretion system protein [Microcoleus sp. PH2017_30_WIL_O_A]MCC3602437.1 type II secretion system protein [Microcoleus sp. PH2017_29_MFU_D_A]MCC3633590.1 type II secretion system protein [Microcoleus sp. PH2017_37_MFU_D_B]TAE58222.1 MAG: type II secretion system protein [Oscillatoriales cyanobacterium]
MSTNKTPKRRSTAPNAGFTMLETLIIIAILGIFCAIASPSWLMFINNQRLKVSVDRAYWAMELAQSNAKRDKIAWQSSFKQVGENLQVAVHKAEITPAQVPANQWKNLEYQIRINQNDTTLRKVNENTNKVEENGTVWRAMFNYQGCPVYNKTDECGLTSILAKGNLTLSHPNLPKGDRCVIISTLLGHTRTSERQRKPNPDNNKNRFCY